MVEMDKKNKEKIKLLCLRVQTTSIQLSEKMREMIKILRDFENYTVADYQYLSNLYKKIEANQIFINAKLDELSEFFANEDLFTDVRHSYDKFVSDFETLIKKKGVRGFFDKNKFNSDS